MSLKYDFVTSFLPWYNSPPSGPRPLHYRGFTITLRHTTLGKTALDGWSARSRDLYLTHSIHPGGIRTHNPSKRAATDPRLRPRAHWDRHIVTSGFRKFKWLIVSYIRMNKAPDKYSQDYKRPVVVKLLFRCAMWFRLHHKIQSSVTRKQDKWSNESETESLSRVWRIRVDGYLICLNTKPMWVDIWILYCDPCWLWARIGLGLLQFPELRLLNVRIIYVIEDGELI